MRFGLITIPEFPKKYYGIVFFSSELHSRSGCKREEKRRIRQVMPPKKRTASESEGPGPLLGRFGTSLKCGIVGLPNVG